MKKTVLSLMLAAQAGLGGASMADTPAPLTVQVKGIEDGQPIPARFAYCMPDGNGKTKNGGNTNPEITWSGAPDGTKSFALVVVDPDVPKTFELANQEGKHIPEDFPRRDFYHWVLVDIPASMQRIDEGKDSNGVVEGGKPLGKKAYGLSGQNDYGSSHGGYDGPCPPWNDDRLHHYHFVVYALDVETLGLASPVTGVAAMEKMQGHVLAKSEIVGTYTNNVK